MATCWLINTKVPPPPFMFFEERDSIGEVLGLGTSAMVSSPSQPPNAAFELLCV